MTIRRFTSAGIVATLVLGVLTALPVAPAQAAYPGDNGRILFAGDGGFGTWDIHTMNPDGTDLVNLTPGAFNAEHAAWSPDGTQIAFSEVVGSPSGCGHGDIYVMNADGSDVTALTTNEFGVAAFDPTWSPDGSEIAFTRTQWDDLCSGGDVDIWKMNSDGSGQVLLAAGTNDFGPAADQEPAWSPDGDRIAFRSNRHTTDWSDSNQIWTMDTDGSNLTQVTHRPVATLERNIAPAWSPDGEQIAYQHFIHRPAGGEAIAQIWRINEDGTGATAVTSNGFLINMNPAWSPDGQQIIFTAAFEEPVDTFNNDIFAINPDGTGQTNLTNTGVAKDRADWQPLVAPPPPPPNVQNGRIAFAGDGGFGTVDIHTMNPDGTDIVNLTPGAFNADHAAWSPDGTRIAFMREAFGPCATGEIYVMNADGSDVTQLTSIESGLGAVEPTWSPDGSEIAFTGTVCGSGDRGDIWKMNSDGSGQVLLAAGANAFGPAADIQPAWSPDGDRIAFSSRRVNADWALGNQIWTMDTDGSNLIQVTHQPDRTFEGNIAPAWSPDGEQIAYEHFPHRPAGGEALSHIWRINEDGTGATAVTTNGFDVTVNMNPAWSPDGQRIVFSVHFIDSSGVEGNEIVAINPDGTGRTELTNTGVAKDSPDWQPLVAAPPPPPPDPNVVVTDCDDPSLATLTTVEGNLVINNVPDCDEISLPSLTEVGGNLIVTNNTTSVISIGAGSITGEVEISGNLVLGAISMGNGMAAGELTIEDNDAEVISMGGGQVAGELSITENDTGTISMGGGQAAGELTISLNETETISMGGGEVTGELTITENDTGAINMGGGQAAGELTVTLNETQVIDMSDEVQVSGNLTIEDNGNAEVIPMGNGSVAGNLDIESTGDGVFSMGSTEVSGELTLDLTGYDEVDTSTPGAGTNVENSRGDATMHVQLPDGAFEAAVAFTITRLDPATLVSVEGVGADDEAASIDPLAAYQFDFDVPTLNADATLSFDIHVDGLDATTRDALLAALDAGTATMATRGDDAGATYQAFPVCTGTEVPATDGCVLIERLDAEGNPTTGTPTTVRFSNVIGHFSTWAVAIVEPIDTTPPVITVTHSVTGDDGWNTNDPVDVTVAASDADSGLASAPICTVDALDASLTSIDDDEWTLSITGEGIHAVSCSVEDNAGNPNSGDDEVKIDTIAPTATISTGAAAYGDTVAFTCITSDAGSGAIPPTGSGVDDASLVVMLDGSPLSGIACDGSANSAPTTGLGVHTLTIDVSDRAGNAADQGSDSFAQRRVEVLAPYEDLMNKIKKNQTLALKLRLLIGPDDTTTDPCDEAYTCDPLLKLEIRNANCETQAVDGDATAPTDSGSSNDTGNDFRLTDFGGNGVNDGYIYNLSTKPSTYEIGKCYKARVLDGSIKVAGLFFNVVQ